MLKHITASVGANPQRTTLYYFWVKRIPNGHGEYLSMRVSSQTLPKGSTNYRVVIEL